MSTNASEDRNCPKCGKSVGLNAQFCEWCGAGLPNQAHEPNLQANQFASASTPTPPRSSDFNSSLILVLGILGFVCCPIFGMGAWRMGTDAIAALEREHRLDSPEYSVINAGRLCGMISTILFILAAIIAFVNAAYSH